MSKWNNVPPLDQCRAAASRRLLPKGRSLMLVSEGACSQGCIDFGTAGWRKQPEPIDPLYRPVEQLHQWHGIAIVPH